VLAGGFALAALLVPRVALASDETELAYGKGAFDVGHYDEAEKRFAKMLDPQSTPCTQVPPGQTGCKLTDPEVVKTARAYHAACLVSLSRSPEAEKDLEELLRSDPSYQLDPSSFPSSMVDLFTKTRARLDPELQEIARKKAEALSQKLRKKAEAEEEFRKWLDEMQRLASQERVVQNHTRWEALIPFGVGQFNNRDLRLGIFFLSSEILLGGGSIATAVLEDYYAHTHPAGQTYSTCASCQASAGTAKTVNNWLFGFWAAATVGGIVQAEAAFQPERGVNRKRPTPTPPTVMPTFSFVPGGAVIGVQGTF
jgi:hypothetical protein